MSLFRKPIPARHSTAGVRRALPNVATTLAMAALVLGSATAQDNATTSVTTDQSTTAGEAAAPTEEQALAGLQVWRERGGCFNCHGEFGQGGEGGHFPAGPSLRRSQLDPDSMRDVISCGISGTPMPYNLEGAYVVHGCYGNDPEPVPADVVPGAGLSPEEIESLLAYLTTHVLGKRQILKKECVYYYQDPDAQECAGYR